MYKKITFGGILQLNVNRFFNIYFPLNTFTSEKYNLKIFSKKIPHPFIMRNSLFFSLSVLIISQFSIIKQSLSQYRYNHVCAILADNASIIYND